MSPATEEEIRVVTDIWIEAFASETERFHGFLRNSIALSLKQILTGEHKVESDGDRAKDCWRAALPMLAAYRAGREA